MGQRPAEFGVNRAHRLIQGATLCGIGRFPNSLFYPDSSLYCNHGLLTTMAVPATATSGWWWDMAIGRWCLNFDGSSDDIRITPKTDYPTASNSPCTVAMLIKPGSVTGVQGLWSRGQVVDNNYSQLFGLNAAKLCVGNNGASTLDSSGSVTNGAWNAVAVAIDATNATYCINRTVEAAAAHNLGTGACGGANPWQIGNTCKTLDTTHFYFTGAIADVLFFPFALSSSQLLAVCGALADFSNAMLGGLLVDYGRPRSRRKAAAASGAISGTAAIAVASTAGLAGSGILAGSSAVTATPAATAKGSAALASVLSLAATLSAVLVGSGSLTGASAIAATPAATIAASGALAGTAAETTTASGTLTATGAIAGTSVIALIGSANPDAGGMVATCAASISAAGTVAGSGAAVGTAAIAVSATATITGDMPGAIGGTCQATVAASGSLAGAGRFDGAVAITVALTATPLAAAKFGIAVDEATWFAPGAEESNVFQPGAEQSVASN